MFDTHLLANAPIVRGRVTGDLILEGAGDPSLDDESLWQLAAQIRGAGVEVVSGDLFVDPSPFGVVTCETEDRCHALQSSDRRTTPRSPRWVLISATGASLSDQLRQVGGDARSRLRRHASSDRCTGSRSKR